MWPGLWGGYHSFEIQTSNKEKGTKHSSVWGKMLCWRVLVPEAEESKDTQNHPHPKAKGSFRSHGVNGDLQIFSEPGSLFWGLSEKGECGQLSGILPEKSRHLGGERLLPRAQEPERAVDV